jgi:hypothetical protein
LDQSRHGLSSIHVLTPGYSFVRFSHLQEKLPGLEEITSRVVILASSISHFAAQSFICKEWQKSAIAGGLAAASSFGLSHCALPLPDLSNSAYPRQPAATRSR